MEKVIILGLILPIIPAYIAHERGFNFYWVYIAVLSVYSLVSFVFFAPQTPNIIALKSVIELIIIGIVYILPSLIAHRRKHHQRISISLLNIFLGWTLLGWVAALIWSASASVKEPLS